MNELAIIATFIGIFLVPRITLGIILIFIGHAFLGWLAIIWGIILGISNL